MARVKRFRGSAAHAKLRKFQQKELDGDWAARQLQDTRYMSKLAAQYLGLLYGGRSTPTMEPCPGQRRGVTAYLRGEWKLNAILADGGDDKEPRRPSSPCRRCCLHRPDRRRYGQTIERFRRRRAELRAPLFSLVGRPGLVCDDVRKSIEAINISYRVNRRVSGLHEETLYSKPQKHWIRTEKAKKNIGHVRKLLQT